MATKKSKKPKVSKTSTLDSLVSSVFQKNAKLIRNSKKSNAWKSRSSIMSIETETITLENKAENVSIVLQRTKEGATVPVTFDTDYTMSATLKDIGVTIMATKTLSRGTFPAVLTSNGIVSGLNIIDNSVYDRLARYLKEAVAVKTASENIVEEPVIEIPEVEIVDEGINPTAPGDEEIEQLVAQEGGTR